MFKLNLFDSVGNKLKMGDIVAVSDHSGRLTFYAEVKYLPEEGVITPFHTFSFHSFTKVNKLPDHVMKSTEERYNIWYTHSPEKNSEEVTQRAEKYLLDWRQCEHLLHSRCFRIELN